MTKEEKAEAVWKNSEYYDEDFCPFESFYAGDANSQGTCMTCGHFMCWECGHRNIKITDADTLSRLVEAQGGIQITTL